MNDAELLQKALQDIEFLRSKVDKLERAKESQEELRDEVSDAIAPHLQLAPTFTTQERKQLLQRYRNFSALPKPLSDNNGLVAKVAQGQPKQYITDWTKFQKGQLDVVRIAADAWDTILGDGDDVSKAVMCQNAIKDILLLSLDNAQIMAKKQLETTFECAQAKGAYGLLNLAEGEQCDIDFQSENILQPAYVDAITDYKKLARVVEQPRKHQQGQRSNRGGFQRRGGFTRRGGFNGGRGGRQSPRPNGFGQQGQQSSNPNGQ